MEFDWGNSNKFLLFILKFLFRNRNSKNLFRNILIYLFSCIANESAGRKRDFISAFLFSLIFNTVTTNVTEYLYGQFLVRRLKIYIICHHPNLIDGKYWDSENLRGKETTEMTQMVKVAITTQ